MKAINKIKILLAVIFVFATAISFVGCKAPDPIYETPKVTIDDYVPPEPIQYNVYDGIVIDGVLDDAMYEEQIPLNVMVEVAGVTVDVSITSYFAEEGVIFGMMAEGLPVYCNPARYPNQNTGFEVYIDDAISGTIYDGAWQLSMDASGKYSNAYHFSEYVSFASYLDVKATVDGDINTPNSNGFSLEFMFPWEYITKDGRPADSIKFDTAIISVNSYTGDRNAWVSINRQLNEKYSWANSKSWYRFTKDGWFDESKAPIYTVNGGETLERGEVIVEGSVKDGYFVKVAPFEGYRVSAFKINDVSYDLAKVNFPAYSAENLDIEVEFAEVNGKMRNITIKSGFAYAENSFADDTSVSLKSADDIIYTGLVGDNSLWQVYVPNGEYSLIAQGYDPITVTIGEETEYKFLFKEKAFVSYDSIDVDETPDSGATVVFDDIGTVPANYEVAKINANFTGKTVISYTLKLQIGEPIFVSIRFHDTWTWKIPRYVNIGSWTNGAYYVKRDDNTNLEVLNASNSTVTTENGKSFIEATFVTVVSEDATTFEVFRKTADGYIAYGVMSSGERAIQEAYVCITDYMGKVEITDFQVYQGDNADNYKIATLSTGAIEDSTVEFNNDTVGFGETATITVTPNPVTEGKNIVKGVYVNGNQVDYTIVDGKYVAEFKHYSNATEYVVTVDTEQIFTRNVTINLTGKDFNGQPANLIGKTATLTGYYGVSFEISQSNFVEIPDGDYILTVDGYIPTTITVSGNSTISAVIGQKFLTDNNKFTSGYNDADGFWYSSEENNVWGNYSAAIPATNNVKISFTYTGKIGSGIQQWTSVCLFDSTGNCLEAQYLTWDSTFRVKNVNGGANTVITTTAGEISVDVVMVYADGEIKVYINNDMNTPFFIVNQSSTGATFNGISSISFFNGYQTVGSNDPWAITNFKVEAIA